MVPIAPTIFWGPMAYAIMGGLAVATVLTLVFLPALYVTWFRIKRPQPDSIQKIDLPQTAIAQPADLKRGSEFTFQPAGPTKIQAGSNPSGQGDKEQMMKPLKAGRRAPAACKRRCQGASIPIRFGLQLGLQDRLDNVRRTVV